MAIWLHMKCGVHIAIHKVLPHMGLIKHDGTQFVTGTHFIHYACTKSVAIHEINETQWHTECTNTRESFDMCTQHVHPHGADETASCMWVSYIT